jgi:hypothetical protein
VLDLYANGGAVFRRSNYPDYVPYVFPATRNYQIDWDYDNFEASVGVRVRLGSTATE